MEFVMRSTSGEQDWILRQGLSGSVGPFSAGKWLVHPLVVQLGPEEVFEWFQAAKVLEKFKNGLLALTRGHP
jgi:hypothetical protein